MLEQTISRLAPLFPSSRLWIVTNFEQLDAVRKQARKIPPPQILAEPAGRNTAAAIALAAVHLLVGGNSEATMAVLPADHFIAHPARYRRIVSAALAAAQRPGALVVLGIPPTRPETGYGYIELGSPAPPALGLRVFHVRRFTEKPSLARAETYAASRKYLWNAGMFFWRVSTFLEALSRHLPQTHLQLLRLSETIGTSRYRSALRRVYPRLENISIDYALLEPASRDPKRNPVLVLPAPVGWSDLGSWAAVYELLARKPGENVSAGKLLHLDSQGNFFWSPRKLIAAVGIRDLIVVETEDALLLCPRSRAQEVGRVVRRLEAAGLRKWL